MEALTLELQFALQNLLARTCPDQLEQLECLISKLLKQDLTVNSFQREVCYLLRVGKIPFNPLWLEVELLKSLVQLERHFGKRMSLEGWHGQDDLDQVVPVRVVGTSAGTSVIPRV